MITMYKVEVVNSNEKMPTYKFVSYIEALKKGSELLDKGYTYKIKKYLI